MRVLASLFPRLRRFWLGASASDATTEAGLEALAGGLPGVAPERRAPLGPAGLPGLAAGPAM